jgi:L-lactate utilization protein LutC
MAIAVTPGISASEYAQRRTKLAAQLPSNGIAIVAASDIVYRTGHVFYPFHQDPDFFYLTGASRTIILLHRTSLAESIFRRLQ